ncbi:MAG: alanine racemase [Armatimonadetes bacterium]|nr:alanine racemase [Armatimonadota bacterium]
MAVFPRTWLEIDLQALRENLNVLRETLGHGGAEIAFVVKSDAYGHGLGPIAKASESMAVDWFAVATVQEGVQIREAGGTKPIMVIAPTLAEEASQAVRFDLDVLVDSLEMLEALGREGIAQGKKARVHLEVDTGLARFGCQPGDFAEFYQAAMQVPGIEVAGASTHFINSAGDRPATLRQIDDFFGAVDQVGRDKLRHLHIANSAGAVHYQEARLNIVRIGISAFGADSYGLFAERVQPVLHWYARVTSLRTLPAGSPVGYNSTYRTSRETRIATLAVGYGDGYGRDLSNRGVVALHGKLAPVIGNVCMDQMMVDVTDIPEVQLGDTAELLGKQIRIQDMAKQAGTITHEISCRLTPRVPRVYIGDEAGVARDLTASQSS